MAHATKQKRCMVAAVMTCEMACVLPRERTGRARYGRFTVHDTQWFKYVFVSMLVSIDISTTTVFNAAVQDWPLADTHYRATAALGKAILLYFRWGARQAPLGELVDAGVISRIPNQRRFLLDVTDSACRHRLSFQSTPDWEGTGTK